tara:strand:+ start:4387 stop:4821 length:435 start_codon:yes stop_codon:yes gene_type:complete
MSERGQLQDYSVDQAAGAIVLVLGAVASLLLVIWQSRCHCKCNLCYLFQCERRPPNEEELKGLKDKAKELQNNRDKEKKDKDKADKSQPPLPGVDPDPTLNRTPSFSNARDSLAISAPEVAEVGSIEPEPEPEPESVASAWKKL